MRPLLKRRQENDLDVFQRHAENEEDAVSGPGAEMPWFGS